MDKPHRPAPLNANDPYPGRDLEERDPMAERRRRSQRFYDDVDAAIAARPAQPTYITRSEETPDGWVITLDDGYDTVIKIGRAADQISRVLEVTSLGDTVRVDLRGSLDRVLYEVLRRDLGIDTNVAPIVGSR